LFSSILLALFRFVETYSGRITIDGVDISGIGLDALRTAITIIPQDASIMSGTIRSNLDPFHEKSDEQLYEVLRMVGLYDKVNDYPDGLDYVVQEHGGNFSVGECQLLALARSLCREYVTYIEEISSISTDFWCKFKDFSVGRGFGSIGQQNGRLDPTNDQKDFH